jgi:alkanesulfonate monooxygenase SsuD/methylene tetrahydromethanopterin reductase-like flavin-dependent oxidoreductase (luciferase family)
VARAMDAAAGSSTQATAQRLRLSFLTHLHDGEDGADSYHIALDLFATAEEPDYDSGWVAQHHFLNGAARLPSTRAFLAAAQRTRRINLGTSIVILPLEDPVRVAEDAAVVDTLSGGRLQLGLATGGDPLPFADFVCQVHPDHPTPGQIVTTLERIAREVAPALGWRPQPAASAEGPLAADGASPP